MTMKVNMEKDLITSIEEIEKMLPRYAEDYNSAIRKMNLSGMDCELTYHEKVALNMYRKHEEYESKIRFMRQLVNKYWLVYLSAVEKRCLQACREELNPEYELTDEEKEALAYLDTPEMRNVRR